jgi:adenylate cyclase
MGIGLNTGQVVVGNIGSEKRTKYGAVGSAINEAYRIESVTVDGQILISPSVYEGAQALNCVQETQEVQLHPVTLYDVVGLRGAYTCVLPEKMPEPLLSLATPLPVACFPIEGKTVSEHAITGVITRLAETSAEATFTGEVALYSNVKLRLVMPAEPELSEVYAKVMALHPGDGAAVPTRVCLGFTALPEDAKAFLARQRADNRGHIDQDMTLER